MAFPSAVKCNTNISTNFEICWSLPSVQRATIDPSSRELGPFVTVPEVTLTPSRFAEASAVIDNHLYVVGGASGRNPVNTVEQADLR